MTRIDMKQTLKHLYRQPAGAPAIVEVPELLFLMADGTGDPNTAPAYAQAIEALYSVAYTLKFMLKKGPAAADYAVMPLQGLWWADDMTSFTRADRAAWRWTMMIAQPDAVTDELFRQAAAQAARKKNPPALPRLRLERFAEGLAAQILHIGPYAAEGPAIERLHEYIAAQGYQLRGKHHEIYLSDPRRSAPERMQTIIRQPVG
jgi:hypothetical protein